MFLNQLAGAGLKSARREWVRCVCVRLDFHRERECAAFSFEQYNRQPTLVRRACENFPVRFHCAHTHPRIHICTSRFPAITLYACMQSAHLAMLIMTYARAQLHKGSEKLSTPLVCRVQHTWVNRKIYSLSRKFHYFNFRLNIILQSHKIWDNFLCFIQVFTQKF